VVASDTAKEAEIVLHVAGTLSLSELTVFAELPVEEVWAKEDDANKAFAFELLDFFWFEEREPEDEDWAGADNWWLDNSDF
jgi:hypothetical protein